MISFFRPEAWCWAALAIVIAVVYLWPVGRKRHEVATYFLWQRALARRPVWFKLRFGISLAVQLLAALLLVAALAQPYWPQLVAARRNIVLILDVSASMSATDVPPSRFDRMIEEAQRAAAGMRPHESLAVISAGSVIRPLCPLTTDRQVIEAAIASAEKTDGVTRVAEAVELARRLLAGKRNPRIMVLSDGAFAEAAALAAIDDVQFKVIRGDGGNVGITHVAVRPTPTDPQAAASLFVEVGNYSAVEAKCGLAVAGEQKDAATLTVPAGGLAGHSFPIRASGMVRVDLSPPSPDLAADNTVRYPVAATARPTATLVTDGAPALEAALKADRRVDLQTVASLPRSFPAKGLTILHRQVPKQLPTGPVLVVAPEAAGDLWTVEGDLRDAAAGVAQVQEDSPLLVGVDFGGVLVEQTQRLRFTVPAEVIAATATGDPLYALIDRPTGPVLVLNVRLDKSDLALRHDFPRLVSNAVQQLLPPASVMAAAVTTADAVRPPAPPLRHGETALGAPVAVLDRVGEWNASGPASKPFVSNLLNPRESNLRLGAGLPSDELELPEPARDQPLWMLLVGAAVGLLFVEWCLFHRRVLV